MLCRSTRRLVSLRNLEIGVERATQRRRVAQYPGAVGRARRAASMWAAGLAAALVAGPLAGCQGTEPAPPPLPSASETSGTAATSPGTTGGADSASEPGADLVTVTSSPPADPAAARVFDDYVRFWQRDMLALRSNDLRGSGVLAFLFPPQLQETATYLAGQRRAGRHTEGTIGIAPAVTSVRSRSATVTDCLDQSRTVDVDRSGRRTRPTPPHLPLTVSLQRGTDDRWKVSDLGRRGGSC
jgi:hypothetical protein